MKLKTLCLITLTGSVIAFNSSTANAFTLLGISDNSSSDRDSSLNEIHLDNFNINNSGIFFTGDAIQKKTSKRLKIVISDASFTNKTSQVRSFNTLLATGNYSLSPSPTDGILSVLIEGENEGINRTNGLEHLIVTASATTFRATTFNDNSVTAGYDPEPGSLLPSEFFSRQEKKGQITSGVGALSARANMSLNPGESLSLEDSIEIELRIPSVPEPSTLFGLGLIVGFGVFSKRQSLKKQQQ